MSITQNMTQGSKEAKSATNSDQAECNLMRPPGHSVVINCLILQNFSRFCGLWVEISLIFMRSFCFWRLCKVRP